MISSMKGLICMTTEYIYLHHSELIPHGDDIDVMIGEIIGKDDHHITVGQTEIIGKGQWIILLLTRSVYEFTQRDTKKKKLRYTADEVEKLAKKKYPQRWIYAEEVMQHIYVIQKYDPHGKYRTELAVICNKTLYFPISMRSLQEGRFIPDNNTHEISKNNDDVRIIGMLESAAARIYDLNRRKLFDESRHRKRFAEILVHLQSSSIEDGTLIGICKEEIEISMETSRRIQKQQQLLMEQEHTIKKDTTDRYLLTTLSVGRLIEYNDRSFRIIDPDTKMSIFLPRSVVKVKQEEVYIKEWFYRKEKNKLQSFFDIWNGGKER